MESGLNHLIIAVPKINSIKWSKKHPFGAN
jgi:hypothetical protein